VHARALQVISRTARRTAHTHSPHAPPPRLPPQPPRVPPPPPLGPPPPTRGPPPPPRVPPQQLSPRPPPPPPARGCFRSVADALGCHPRRDQRFLQRAHIARHGVTNVWQSTTAVNNEPTMHARIQLSHMHDVKYDIQDAGTRVHDRARTRQAGAGSTDAKLLSCTWTPPERNTPQDSSVSDEKPAKRTRHGGRVVDAPQRRRASGARRRRRGRARTRRRGATFRGRMTTDGRHTPVTYTVWRASRWLHHQCGRRLSSRCDSSKSRDRPLRSCHAARSRHRTRTSPRLLVASRQQPGR
jgi:hypothetical protein